MLAHHIVEATGRAALALQPDDAWATHAVTHVMEMQRRTDEGIRFLESSTDYWAAPENTLQVHNWWHLALFYLDRGDTPKVLELYDSRVVPQEPFFVQPLIDATSLLWRLQLAGADVRDRFEQVATLWQQQMEPEAGFHVFADLHAAMAFGATGRAASSTALRTQMQNRGALTAFNVGPSFEVGVPLARALGDFAAGRYDAARRGLEAMQGIAQRATGSNAQRDIFTLTLIEAARRAGAAAEAARYAEERRLRRVHARAEAGAPAQRHRDAGAAVAQ